ncbi:MAG: hypothetical protein ACRD6N_00145 [Pyrinomonadaceae bacterium]
MDFTTIFVIAGVVIFAIFILIARLAIRWIIRLAIIGIIIIALLGGGVIWWWTNSLKPTPQQNRSRPSPTRRASH